jgi:hypothetical protein
LSFYAVVGVLKTFQNYNNNNNNINNYEEKTFVSSAKAPMYASIENSLLFHFLLEQFSEKNPLANFDKNSNLKREIVWSPAFQFLRSQSTTLNKGASFRTLLSY